MTPVILESQLKTLIWGTEQWGISAHPNGDDKVLNPEYEGLTLSSLWKEKKELFGECRSSVFPLLTKIIDARDDLSIQVHPDDAYAAKNENGSLGKTECWYIMDAEPGTKIVIGHNAKDSAEVRSMIENGQWSAFIREVTVKKGDFFFIEPGTVHAIKGGTKILETQQSSDITYRVYDYGRLQNGKPRELHVKQSIDVIKAPFVKSEPPLNPSKKITAASNEKNVKQLVSCPLFTVWHAEVKGEGGKLEFWQQKSFMLFSVISGSVTLVTDETEKAFSYGEHFIIPAVNSGDSGKFLIKGSGEMIISCV